MTRKPPTFYEERAIAAMRRLRGDYESGLVFGHEYAKADSVNSHSFATGEAELRAEAVEARGDSPSWRAFKLGIVRGYRDAVRTLRAGKWGT